MVEKQILVVQESSGGWGGLWTEKKLDAFERYVNAYLTIMQKNPYWKAIYFDGFAGTGSRKDVKTPQYEQLNITQEEEEFYKGAAERVIRLEKSFDYYYFIDDRKSLEKLEKKLRILDEAEEKQLIFKPEDCNVALKKLADAMIKSPEKYAALVFLDPFGMHIDWDAIAGLKGTRSDVWILIPTGVIVNRLLDKAGKLMHIERLESFFGLSKEEIKAEFFQEDTVSTLFGDEKVMKKISDAIHHIAALYIRQLKMVWGYVTESPLVLCNTRNVPIYHFVFASNNKVAKKIAAEIIKRP